MKIREVHKIEIIFFERESKKAEHEANEYVMDGYVIYDKFIDVPKGEQGYYSLIKESDLRK